MGTQSTHQVSLLSYTIKSLTRKLKHSIIHQALQALDKTQTASDDHNGTKPKGKTTHSGMQTSLYEMIDSTTSMRDDDGVYDAEAEIEVGATDKIQKFITGLFGDGPRAKGIQTERLDRKEQIVQTDIDMKKLGILEQKLLDVSTSGRTTCRLFKPNFHITLEHLEKVFLLICSRDIMDYVSDVTFYGD